MRTRLMEIAETEPEERAPLGLSVPDAGSPMLARAEHALGALLFLNLKTLSQKTLAALMSLADLMLIGSAFALWYRAMADPTLLQLVGLGGYSAFILVALWARRK